MVEEHYPLPNGYRLMLTVATTLFPDQINEAIAYWNQLEAKEIGLIS
jgi:hypothetical protein